MHDLSVIMTITGGFTAALIFGYVTHRLGMSSIVGYLLAGIAVGSHTPGFVADHALAEQFAEIGVILLMFGVGLQFHVRELLEVRRVAIPGAVCQCLLATALSYLDRQTMALCATMIQDEFQLDNEQWGRLLGAFRTTYGYMQIIAGYFADRFSVRMVYALAVGVWSAAGAAAFFVAGPAAMAWTRRVLGMGEAFNWPCALRVTANTLPPEDRGLANGFFTSGAATGSLLAPFIIVPLAEAFGWRMAFLVIGALGALWIVLWWFSTRRPGVLDASKAILPTELPGAVDTVVPAHSKAVADFTTLATLFAALVGSTTTAESSAPPKPMRV